MSDLLAIAKLAAMAGSRVVAAAHARREFVVSEKSRADFVTEVDVASEHAVVAVIRSAFPDHDVVGEEGTTTCSHLHEMCWIIDPLDGTTNFIHDIPFFAVAVSVERRGVPIAAAIADPVRGDVYTAAAGEGAWLGERRLRVSPEEKLGSSLVLTGIPFRNLDVMPAYLPGFERVARASAGIRRMGSAALDLAAIAVGRAEAFWEFGLARWDISAGMLLVEEAGGRVTDFAGTETHLATGNVVASNGHVHVAMLREIAAGILSESAR